MSKHRHGTPSTGVSHVPAARRGARPPHPTATAWWLAYVAALVVVGLFALVLFLNAETPPAQTSRACGRRSQQEGD